MIAVPVAELLDRELARFGMAVDVGDLAAYRRRHRHAKRVRRTCTWVRQFAERAWTTPPPHAGRNCAWCGAALQPGEPEVCTDCLGRGLPVDEITVELADDIDVTGYWSMSAEWLDTCRQALLLAEKAGAGLAEAVR